MAVVFDASTGSGNTTDTGSVLTVSNTHLTVGSGSNRALIAFLTLHNDTAPPSLACAWDPSGTNQAMSLISGTGFGSGSSSMYSAIFGLLNPTPGNKTLTASWSTSSMESHLAAVSFTGVNQTDIATAFPGGTASEGTVSSGSFNVTSAVGDMVVALFTNGSAAFASTSGSTIDLDTTAGGFFAMATLYQSGAATVTATAAWGGTSIIANWAGCNVKAAVGASQPWTGTPILGPILVQ